MLLIDANAILRYMLNDNTDMAAKVRDLLENTAVSVRCEVLAEVVYVLNKVYSMPRAEIADCVGDFLRLSNVVAESEEVLLASLETYAATTLDFVDCILYGFKAVYDHDVFTFDKQLNSMLNKITRNG